MSQLDKKAMKKAKPEVSALLRTIINAQIEATSYDVPEHHLSVSFSKRSISQHDFYGFTQSLELYEHDGRLIIATQFSCSIDSYTLGYTICDIPEKDYA